MIYLAIAVVVLFLLAIVAMLLSGEVEVEPGTAQVYKNILTGKVQAYLKGVYYLMPWEKQLKTISLRNEPNDPPTIQVNTADPIKIGVDFVLTDFRVDEGEESIAKVFERIDYEKRLSDTLTRLSVVIQDSIGRRRFNELYHEGTNRDELLLIETEVNRVIAGLKDEWGLIVKIQIRDITIPDSISEAKEDMAKATYEGDALRKKAEAAGNNPNVRDVIIADAVIDAIRAFRGGK